MRIGPGVNWPSASPSMNSWAVSQWSCSTTRAWMNAIIASPPPTVRAPTSRKNVARPARPGDQKDAEHDRTEPIERAADERRDAQRRVRDGERQHDRERGQHEADPAQERAPPAPARVAQEQGELRRRGAGQHVDERQPLEE